MNAKLPNGWDRCNHAGEWKLWTPEECRAELDVSLKYNRKLYQRKVEEYKRLLRTDLGGPSVILLGWNDQAGCQIVLDGNHRFMAVWETGISWWFYTIRDWPADGLKYIDNNRTRSNADALRFAGVVPGGHERHVATIVRAIRRGGRGSRSIANVEIIPIYQSLCLAVDFARKAFPTFRRKLTVAGVYAAWGRAWLQEGRDEPALLKAAFALRTEDFGGAKVMRSLRDRLLGLADETGGYRRYALTYRNAALALSAFLRGKEGYKQPQWGDAFADPFPIATDK